MNKGEWYLTCVGSPGWGMDPILYPRVLLEATTEEEAIREGSEKWSDRNNIEIFTKVKKYGFGYFLKHPSVDYVIKLETE